MTPPEQDAWQFAFALTETSHFGGTKSTFSVPPAEALTVPMAVTAAEHQRPSALRLSVSAPASSCFALSAPRSTAIERQAVVRSSIDAAAMPAKSAMACTATLACAPPPILASMVAPALNSVQQTAPCASETALQPFERTGIASAVASNRGALKRFNVVMQSSP